MAGYSRGGNKTLGQEPTRDNIFASAAAKLRQDFLELRVVPHRGVKGDEANRLVKAFLDAHLPKRFSVGSGFIIDRRDNVSKQTDVIIYDALNCPVYRASDEAGIFPADNVAAVVEVKSKLDGEKLRDAAENIAAAKGLAKTTPPPTPFLVQTQTLGCVFAFESELTVDTIAERYGDVLRKGGLGHHIDLILLLDRAVYSLAAKPRGADWAPCIWEGWGGPAAEGSHFAVAAHLLHEASLDGFLRMLLAQLTFFRGIVAHPGFALPGKQIKLFYLTSHTDEADPTKREERLRAYAEEVRKGFAENPGPGEQIEPEAHDGSTR
jgi:hypothetical protein